MDIKFGKIKATKETYSNPQKQNFETTEENFFNTFQHRHQEQNQQQSEKQSAVIPLRLNDMDSNILENKAYNNLEDVTLKLEQKIITLEQSIEKIAKDISTIEGLGYDIQLCDLRNKKTVLEQELTNLKQEYANYDISTRLSNSITSMFNVAAQNKNTIKAVKSFFKNQIFSKFSKKFKYTISMKEALNNLNNINDSIDELIKMQVPYGESVDRYKKLTAYLNKANLIHSQINSKINIK